MQSNRLSTIIASVNTEYAEYKWDGLLIHIRPIISIEETIELTDSVMRSCVHPTTNVFMPELLDLMFRINIIRFYTDVELPDNLHDQHTLVYGTDLYNDVLSAISDGQVKAMTKCLDLFANRLSLYPVEEVAVTHEHNA